MNQDHQLKDVTPHQEKQYIRNPSTGEMMELNTYSGKEFFWRETNEENADS